MFDLGTTVGGINYLHGNLRRFMRPERRHVAAIFKPASARVEFQPLGVVGIVSPWNFPVSLALVPVTLELGGKSPVIIDDDYPVRTAARRIAYGKCANGGQICVSPDYLLLPKGETEDFIAAYRQEVDTQYPNIGDNPDYTSIVNDRHFSRLSGLVEDAKAKGARVIELGTRQPSGSPSRQFPPVLLLDVTSDMAVMQEEIFGPILPVVTYDELDDAIAYVNARPRPLALYFFGNDAESQARVLERTTSGSVLVNDTILQYAQDDLPFGGVGPSGMGTYHGAEGFKTMSHAKSVFKQGRVNVVDLFRPPFGRAFDFLLGFMLR